MLKGSFKLGLTNVDQHGDLPENWQVKKAQEISNLVELSLTRSLFHKYDIITFIELDSNL